MSLRKMNASLFFVVLACVACTNARHVDETSLLEALERFFTAPEKREVRGIPVERVVRGKDLLVEQRDTELCDVCPNKVSLVRAEMVASECKGKEIAPLFKKPNLDSPCTCLDDYICCPVCGQPPTEEEVCAKDKGCNQLMKEKKTFMGYYRFLKVVDCCGCTRIHTVACPIPRPLLCPLCMMFKSAHNIEDDGCYTSGCVDKPPPTYSPADKECDDRCQKAGNENDQCGHEKPVCDGIYLENCKPGEPEHNPCYEDPLKILTGNWSWDATSNSCSEECYRWLHVPKPIVPELAICDDKCQRKTEETDICGTPVENCVEKEVIDDCHPATPRANICQKPPVKVKSNKYNYNRRSKSCGSPCFSWTVESKAPEIKKTACDDKCFEKKSKDLDCGGFEEFCEAKTCERNECRPEQPEQQPCFELAEKRLDTEVFCANGDSCEECWDWKRPKRTACAPTINTCHYFESDLPDRCFEMISIKDECCEAKTCTRKEETCVQKFSLSAALFSATLVCPKGSVLITGTSSCGTTRDLCFPCPEVEVVCSSCQVSTVERNLVGCQVGRCEKKSCPSIEIPACDFGTLEIVENDCECKTIICRGA